METAESIYFFGEKKEFGFLSNFYSSSFEEDEKIFNCNEQYFMYHKCLTFDKDNDVLLNKILNETKPFLVKKLGRQVKNFDEKKWEKLRYEIMKNGLFLKFTQNETLKQKLKETGNKTIYEASPFDKIWGIGFSCISAQNKDKSLYGRNLLGNALMEIREKILSLKL